MLYLLSSREVDEIFKLEWNKKGPKNHKAIYRLSCKIAKTYVLKLLFARISAFFMGDTLYDIRLGAVGYDWENMGVANYLL